MKATFEPFGTEPGEHPNESHALPKHTVELPAGGILTLLNADEVTVWDDTKKRYLADYRFEKANDLIALGAILSQVLTMYRAQKELSDPDRGAQAQALITKAMVEIRALESSMSMDKKARESGGQHTLADYVTNLKRAGNARMIKISERVKAYERVCMDARWKIRLLRNGDAEDRREHDISEKSIVLWLENELAELERLDREWAAEKGAVWRGQL